MSKTLQWGLSLQKMVLQVLELQSRETLDPHKKKAFVCKHLLCAKTKQCFMQSWYEDWACWSSKTVYVEFLSKTKFLSVLTVTWNLLCWSRTVQQASPICTDHHWITQFRVGLLLQSIHHYTWIFKIQIKSWLGAYELVRVWLQYSIFADIFVKFVADLNSDSGPWLAGCSNALAMSNDLQPAYANTAKQWPTFLFWCIHVFANIIIGCTLLNSNQAIERSRLQQIMPSIMIPYSIESLSSFRLWLN